ncbi:aquaporin-2-like isoform X2 [Lytechinus variegatus]|uniref:aquaporin-2-like isoform X2 n=1 Tax=Lytechinus variegatus TaxID=7654 RepID=UPI001BB2B3F6|nr:aquaporin-2-like isoform X2 [Lytechinus variegatus]
MEHRCAVLVYDNIQRKPAPRHTVVMANEVKSIGFWRAVAAEFVGMFFFIFISLASISGWNAPYIPSMVQISLAFGLGLATSIHVTAHISGGHLNPAVSFAFLMLHRITPLRFLFYSLAQMIGAIAAAGMVRAITPADINNALGATTPGTDVTEWQALLMELVITYQLVLVIFATIDKRRPSSGGSGPLAIGIAVLVAHLCAIQYSGASMNPARSLGSAVVGGVWTAHWVYWVGPMVGGLLGAITYDYILDPNVNASRLRRCTTCEYGDEEDYATSDEMNLNSIQTASSEPK